MAGAARGSARRDAAKPAQRILTAAVLMAPFVVIYGVLFVYPTLKMVELAFTNAPLIGPGAWVGFDNFRRLTTTGCSRPRSGTRFISSRSPSRPSTLLGLVDRARRQPAEGLAAERRARGVLPALHPAGFGRVPHLELDVRQGFRGCAICPRAVERRPACFGVPHSSLFHAGGRVHHDLVAARIQRAAVHRRACATFPREIYEAAELDGASRWTQFRRITWPLIWPVTVLVFTIQLILQFKIFDQVYLFAAFIVRYRSDDGDGGVHLTRKPSKRTRAASRPRRRSCCSR